MRSAKLLTRHGCRPARWILLLLLLSALPLGEAFAVCSSYRGFATINEVSVEDTGFVEVKLLNGALAASAYNGWHVRVCQGSPSATCTAQIPLSAATPDLPYLVVSGLDGYIDLRNGMDVILTDAGGNTIDYLSVDGYLRQQDASCGPVYPWQVGGSNTFTVKRLPDGTGAWSYEPGNSGPVSEGDSNLGTTVPTLSAVAVTAVRGQPAVFAFVLSEAAGSDVTIAYRTEDGTATSGDDYVATTGTVTIPAGSVSITVSVSTLPTSDADGDYFYLVLTNVAEANVDNHYIAATITAPPMPPPLASWRMEEAAGVPEAADSAGNGYDGIRGGGATTADTNPAPAVPGNPGTCRYTTFGGEAALLGPRDYISVPGFPAPATAFTFSAWINTASTAGGQSIVDDYAYPTWFTPGHDGYALAIDGFSGGQGRLAARVSGATVNTPYVLATNQWYFVALSVTPLAGATRVTITVLDAAGSIVARTIEKPAVQPSEATGSMLLGNSSFGLFPFDGRIDEVSYHGAELSVGQLQQLRQQTHPCGATPIHHFEIVHDDDGLTCTPEAVTVRACSDETCSSLYAGSVDVTLTPAGWVGGDAQLIAGGSASVSLRWVTAGDITLGIAGASIPPLQPTVCRTAGGVSDCSVTFHDTGFVFDIPNQRSCATSADIVIRAVRKDDTTQLCVPAFDGNVSKQLEFSFAYEEPATGTRPLSVIADAGTVTLPTDGNPSTVELEFTGSEARFAVSYPDAGRIRLNTSHTDSGLLMDGDASFVVTPHSFAVSATTDGTSPLNNGTSTGTPHWPAGQDFRLLVRAQCADGTTTPNYSPTSAQLGVEPLLPAGGVDGAVVLNGQSYPAASPVNWQSVPNEDFSRGAIAAAGETDAAASYSEVGVIAVHVRDDNYLSTVIPEASQLIGRFRPHHFTIAANTPQLRHALDPWACGFTYLGQPFGFETDPAFTITAHNAVGGITRNYDGAFWKLDGGLVGRVYQDGVNGVPIAVETSGGSAVTSGRGDFDGTAVLTVSGDELRYQKPLAPQVAFDSSIDLAIPPEDLTDTDGACYDDNGDGTCDSYTLPAIAGTQQRFGRLAVTNGYGSELRPLNLPVRAEYWQPVAGAEAFVANADDSCTGLSASPAAPPAWGQLVLDDYRLRLDQGETAPSVTGVLSGTSAITLTAPGDGNDGSVRVTVGADAWLEYDWDGDGVPQDPSGRATFGIYRGDDRVIYRREVFN